jgi:hypothetical protein
MVRLYDSIRLVEFILSVTAFRRNASLDHTRDVTAVLIV